MVMPPQFLKGKDKKPFNIPQNGNKAPVGKPPPAEKAMQNVMKKGEA